MKITEQTRLNRGEQEAIRALLTRCRDKEPFTVTFPMLEQGTKFFILRDEESNAPRSVLALCPLGETDFEVSAFTDPEYRRQGFFRKLWEKAKLSLPGKSSVSEPVTVRFALDSALKDALPVLLSIGAALKGEETEMRCDISEKTVAEYSCSFRRSAPSGEGVICYEALSKNDSRPVFRCYVLPLKEGHCYLSRVSVRKDLIGTGVGSRVFPEFLAVLKRQGYKTASMQVSAANIPAVKLYEANGFRAFMKLRYYELSF